MSESFSASGSRVHTPFGPRKSGMPDSVDMPAPVRTTTRLADSTHSRTVVIVATGVTCAVINAKSGECGAPIEHAFDFRILRYAGVAVESAATDTDHLAFDAQTFLEASVEIVAHCITGR